MTAAVLFLMGSTASTAFAEGCPPLDESTRGAITERIVLERIPVCNPAVRAAAGTIDAALADRRIAGQRPNPDLSVGASGLSSSGLGAGSWWNKNFDHQIGIAQTIERGDKPALRVANADGLLAVTRAEVGEAIRQARAQTRQALHDLRFARERETQVMDASQLASTAQQALERRVRAGAAAPLDATRFALDATRLQADLRAAQADVQRARLQLAALTGLPAQGLDVAKSSDDPAASGGPRAPDTSSGAAARAGIASATSTALASIMPAPDLTSIEQRADVVAALRRVQAAQSAAALARSLAKRDVGVGLGFSHSPPGPNNPGSPANTVSVSVSVPLHLRHAYEGEMRRAQADLAIAEESLARARITALNEVERALADAQAARLRYALINDRLAPDAERVAAGAELAYARGASGVLDVLDARRSLRLARIDRINAQAEQVRALVQLEAALEPLNNSTDGIDR